jgi:hypothetical protein
MGKAQRIREMNTRQRIAAQQAAARKAEARRRLYLASGSVLVVIAVVVGLIIAKNAGSGSATGGSATAAEVSHVSSQITTVPASTLNAVGAGSGVTPLQATQGNPAILTSGGKTEILYVGAEYCPYCAAERWAMAVALSRFGSFTPLRGVHSSPADVYPNTATLTFFGATYTSKYLVFTPVENQDVNHNPLQTPTAAQTALWAKYEPPGNSYPFIDIGNRFVATTTYNPQVLQGLSWNQIAADLHTPSSPVSQGAVGSANLLTAAICKITGNAPASVCGASPIPALESRI